MARSLSNVKMVANLVLKHVSSVTKTSSRRGIAAVSQGVEVSEKVVEKKPSAETASWTPHPKTGYYRPENAADEIDVAELREMLRRQVKNAKN